MEKVERAYRCCVLMTGPSFRMLFCESSIISLPTSEFWCLQEKEEGIVTKSDVPPGGQWANPMHHAPYILGWGSPSLCWGPE